MNVIKSVEIKYFRSIYNLKINGLKDLNTITGKNDVGKSNILKALNLFFNGNTEFETPLDFYKDFSLKRLNEVRQHSIKGKQFISIKITFNRGQRFNNTLPQVFSVTKRWHRNSSIPDQSDDILYRLKLEGQEKISAVKSSTSLTKFLNIINYIYIPAIRDQSIFNSLMEEVQEIILKEQPRSIAEQLTNLNEFITSLSTGINDDFMSSTGIESSVSLPTSAQELYKAFFVHTKYGDDSEYKIPLNLRGDGIRLRYIPSLLSYIDNRSNDIYIWGFEEPENSLEYSLCLVMAECFKDNYSKGAQIFLTSHSPAFFLLEGENVFIMRIGQDDYETVEIPYDSPDNIFYDLGLDHLYKEHNEKITEQLELNKKYEQLLVDMREKIEAATKNLVITEGKTDRIMLETAWRKIYGDQSCPFRIESCDILEEDDISGGSGGISILEKILYTVRYNSPHVTICLFDHDDAGWKAFNKLKGFFSSVNDIENTKIHIHKKAIATLLPIPPSKHRLGDFKNFPIEYYFSESALKTTVDGRGLVLISKLEKTFNGKTVDSVDSDDICFMVIDSGSKVFFVEQVLPTLDEMEFTVFKLLFEHLLSIFEKYI